MAKKKKVECRFIKVTVFCGHCENEVDVSKEDLLFYGSSQDCGMCGSHGNVTMDLDCTNCGKNIEFEVAGW